MGTAKTTCMVNVMADGRVQIDGRLAASRDGRWKICNATQHTERAKSPCCFYLLN